MKSKRHRLPPINLRLSLTLDDGIPKCPFCHKPFDAALPLIGGNGVSVCFIHDRGETDEFRHEHGVLSDDEMDIDFDDNCVYEIGGGTCDVS